MKLRSKIQHSMIMVITVTLLAAYALTTLVIYRQNVGLMERETRQEADYIVKAIEISGTDYLKQMDEVEKNTRITLIDPAGDVLYDSTEDAVTLQNHKNRPEIKAAHKNGTGQEVRRSMTMSKEMFYYAKLLPDGNVLRVSKTMNTALHTAISILPIMGLIAVVALAFAYLLSRQQVAKLIRPINELDLEEPLKEVKYEELRPLLKRVDQQNRQIARQIEELKEAEAVRKEFSANVSHELKTPLMSISGYAELMMNGMVPPDKMQDFSGRIFHESERLSNLVADIIQLSRLDEKNGETMFEQVDIGELGEDVINNLQNRAAKKKINLEYTGGPAQMQGVRHVLYEMFYNITDNAIRYTPDGGDVKVFVGKLNGKPYFRVEDNGIGIPESEQQRIFERFYRVDKSHSRETGGTGLGLSIVKHGAVLHHAKILLDSEPGKGTKMEILFDQTK